MEVLKTKLLEMQPKEKWVYFTGKNLCFFSQEKATFLRELYLVGEVELTQRRIEGKDGVKFEYIVTKRETRPTPYSLQYRQKYYASIHAAYLRKDK